MSRKTSLATQTGKIWLIVRKDKEISYDHINQYLSIYADEYAYIKHENDINSNGVVEGIHYHIVYNLKEQYKRDRLSTTLNHVVECLQLDNAFGIEIEKYDSIEGCIQYLTHKNQPTKTQHDVSEIITNIDKETFDLYYNADLTDLFKFDTILAMCKSCNNKLELIRQLWPYYKDVSKFRVINEIWDLTKFGEKKK